MIFLLYFILHCFISFSVILSFLFSCLSYTINSVIVFIYHYLRLARILELLSGIYFEILLQTFQYVFEKAILIFLLFFRHPKLFHEIFFCLFHRRMWRFCCTIERFFCPPKMENKNLNKKYWILNQLKWNIKLRIWICYVKQN